MTAPELHFADDREAADLAAFLARLIHYDRAAAVRLQAGAAPAPHTGGVLAVFGRPPSFEVLAIRTARLTDPVAELDVTVSAGQFADALDTARAQRSGSLPGALSVVVPDSVTGPPWAGVLPPRGGWRPVEGLPDTAAMRAAVASAVAEFRARDEQLPEERRTRAERDRIGREIWSRTLGETGLPLRAVHAAQSLGFLGPVRVRAGVGAGAGVRSGAALTTGAHGAATTAVVQAIEGRGAAQRQIALLAARGWLRLRTPYGSVAVRTGGLSALPVSPA